MKQTNVTVDSNNNRTKCIVTVGNPNPVKNHFKILFRLNKEMIGGN
jgi:hypothetical protein